jgi:hypothetical protein
MVCCKACLPTAANCRAAPAPEHAAGELTLLLPTALVDATVAAGLDVATARPSYGV